MNVSFSSNYTGDWSVFSTYSNVTGTVVAFLQVEYNTTYYWYANLTLFGNDSVYNQTAVYSFTTAESYNNCTAYILPDSMELSFDATTWANIFLFLLFFILFWMGYKEDNKRSAGAFLFVSGLLLIMISVVNSAYTAIPILGLLSILSFFIMMMGINKWLIKPNMADKEKQEPS